MLFKYDQPLRGYVLYIVMGSLSELSTMKDARDISRSLVEGKWYTFTDKALTIAMAKVNSIAT